jgi:hypothetical protein
MQAVTFLSGLFPDRDKEVTIAGMNANAIASDPAAAIWRRVLQLRGDLSAGAARALLQLQFTERDHDRMASLSAKAQHGTLADREQSELDAFERLGCLLDIVHSEARRGVKKRRNRGSSDDFGS